MIGAVSVCPAAPHTVPAMLSQNPVCVSGPTAKAAIMNGICSTIAAA